jgi:plastocyanin domain-containing protein
MRRLLAIAALVLIAGCAPSGPSEVQVSVTDNGFEPKSVVIKKGESAVLVITRKSENTCATDVVFTETGRKYDLPLNTPVRVDLTGAGPGTIHYACGMDMEHGTVTIE